MSCNNLKYIFQIYDLLVYTADSFEIYLILNNSTLWNVYVNM